MYLRNSEIGFYIKTYKKAPTSKENSSEQKVRQKEKVEFKVNEL